MVYILAYIFELIKKYKWWAVIIIPLLVLAVIYGVSITGGFNFNTGNEFLEIVFDAIIQSFNN